MARATLRVMFRFGVLFSVRIRVRLRVRVRFWFRVTCFV